jgi:hypothetical protein
MKRVSAPKGGQAMPESALPSGASREGGKAAMDGYPRGEAPRAHAEHKVNIRLSLPLPFGRAYITLLAGHEKRNPKRLARERADHALWTLGNILFFSVASAFLFVLSATGLFAALLLFSSVIEF